jgi:hypothetical protein
MKDPLNPNPPHPTLIFSHPIANLNNRHTQHVQNMAFQTFLTYVITLDTLN